MCKYFPYDQKLTDSQLRIYHIMRSETKRNNDIVRLLVRFLYVVFVILSPRRTWLYATALSICLYVRSFVPLSPRPRPRPSVGVIRSPWPPPPWNFCLRRGLTRGAHKRTTRVLHVSKEVRIITGDVASTTSNDKWIPDCGSWSS